VDLLGLGDSADNVQRGTANKLVIIARPRGSEVVRLPAGLELLVNDLYHLSNVGPDGLEARRLGGLGRLVWFLFLPIAGAAWPIERPQQTGDAKYANRQDQYSPEPQTSERRRGHRSFSS